VVVVALDLKKHALLTRVRRAKALMVEAGNHARNWEGWNRDSTEYQLARIELDVRCQSYYRLCIEFRETFGVDCPV
jgi:hypothetical protein